MERMYRCVLVLALVFQLSACSLFVREPRVEIKSTELVGLSASGIDLEFSLAVTNTNGFDLALLGYSYDLRIMALPVSSGAHQETTHFPSGTTTDMRLPIHIKFRDLLEVVKRQPDFERLPYQLSAQMLVQSPLGEFAIPVDRSDSLRVPENFRPDAAIDRLRNLLLNVR